MLRLIHSEHCAACLCPPRLQLSGEGAAQGVPAADPALSLHSVTEALRAFFVAVSSPDALPEFTHLQQPRLRSEAVSK